MDFYFCGKCICTDGDDKEVEWDMYVTISYFQCFNDCYEYKDWESQLEDLCSYFSLTTEEKYRYAQLKLMEKLIIDGKTTTYYVGIGFTCVLSMLRIFIQLLSPSPRANKSLIPLLSFGRP